MAEPQQYRTVDKYDRAFGALVSLPDVTHTKPSTIQIATPFVGEAQTFVIQVFRQTDRGVDPAKSRDTLFLQYVDSGGSHRFVVPHEVIEAIIRHKDSLTKKVRKKSGKATAAARKARGDKFGFEKKGKA